MAVNPRRKSDAARWANRVVRSRTILLMVLLGVATFVALLWKLYSLQVVRHDEMWERAVNQQTRSATVPASRGTIYDCNGYMLAVSSTAEEVNISPKEIAAFVKSQEESIEAAREKAAQKGQSYEAPQVRDQTYIARGLSRILEVDQAKIEESMTKTNLMYVNVRKKTELDMANEVRRFINGEIDEEGNEVPETQRKRLQGVWMNPDSKRVYPYSSLGSNVIGFVNAENKGGVGLEAKYDSELEGTAGLTVTAKNAAGTDMLYNYEQMFDAENGHNLVLTMDVSVQAALEKGIENMAKKFDAKNGATGIIMNVNSGAIVGMASYPNYDLNDYGTVYDDALRAKLQATLDDLAAQKMNFSTEEDYDAAVSSAKSSAVQTQWRNKCVDSTYEPGSTYKPITLAAALEEGTVNMNSTFNCSGSVKVGVWTINCSKKAGHGLQTLEQAVGNSCNPAFIRIGQSVGAEKYYQYMKAFGLTEKTGVDMVGETKGIVSENSLKTDVAALASYSFGQTFTVTPLELIRAQAACINGGYLYTPYIVEQVLDDDGNIISQHDATPIRQVVSEETSAKVRQCLEYVVASGTGKNGQVAGYRIGGKTGTADKTETKAAGKKPDLVVSFMCFAPADDPQYIMLLTLDTPSRTTGTYPSGGNMVAPTASQIMAEVLPYLGIEPDYSAEELAGADAAVPNVVGKAAADAKAVLESAGFTCRTVGNGDTVTDQTPAGGAIVPNNASIILYLGTEKSTAPSVVPNVVGKTAAQANKALSDAGLIMKVAGATTASSGNVFAITQDKEPGTELKAGSVVTVQFGSQSAGAD